MLQNALIAVTLVSLISFTGAITLFLKQHHLKNILLFLIALASGAMFGDVFIHIIPEIYENTELVEQNGNLISLSILGGIILFFIIEKILLWQHCHHLPGDKSHHGESPHHHPAGINSLISDGFHNFIDGVLIAASFLISTELGIATTLAVILHEIPQEIGNFATLVESKYSPKKALFYNFLSALAAFLGAILTFAIGPQLENTLTFLIPLTAGSFIYIAGSDLIPMLHTERKPAKFLPQLIFFLIGMASMYLLLFLE